MIAGRAKKDYRLPEWQAYRVEMLEREGYKCSQCGRSKEVGVVLQVHHKSYVTGRRPWDYPYDDCEVLCRGCHGELHGRVRPSIGWKCFGDDDLGDLCGNCELCGTELRYVFFISHPHWEPMEVGTVCCDHLTETEYASNKVDSITKCRERAVRFVESPRWRNERGVQTITQKGFTIQLVIAGAAYRLKINSQMGKQMHPTPDAAKLAAFDVIENGKAEEYLRKRR